MGWFEDQHACWGEDEGPRSRGGLPVADAKSCDTVRHLDDNELATALHLARLALPDLI